MATIKSYKDKNGNTKYEFQLYLGVDPLTNKAKRTRRRGFNSAEEAKIILSRLELQLRENGSIKKEHTRTFQEVYDLWFKSYKGSVKTSTWVTTERIFNLHILPLTKDWRVSKITIEDCQKICDQWFKEDLVQYKRFNNYVRKVLDYAIHIGERNDNPATFVIPKVNKERDNTPTTIEYYTKEQLELLFDTLKNSDNYQAYAMLRTLAMSGLRKGECLSLEWTDVDVETGTITVNKTQSSGKKGRLITQTPKTKQSNRVVYIDPETAKILQMWRIKQREYLFNFGYNINKKNNYVFSNEHNNMHQPVKPSKWLNSAAKKAGLPHIKVHSLRKTFATLNAEMGVDEATVQKQLGHSVGSLVTRQIYMAVTEKTRKKETEKFFKSIDF